MLKNYTIFSFFLLISLVANTAFAQTTDGCDGTRYFFDVFDNTTKTTVKYAENTDALGNLQELFMDVYEPEGDLLMKRPLVVFAFGGGFVAGDRETMAQSCIDFAKKGYVAATIDYRLWNILFQGVPDSLQMFENAVRAVSDMRGAIRYFRQDAETNNQFRIDPDFIFAGGVSAGAFTAIHVGHLDADDTLPAYAETIVNRNGGIEGDTGDSLNMQYSSDVQAVINMSGALHKKDWMDADDPPFISYHGTSDLVVPYKHGNVILLGFRFMSVDGSGLLKERADEVGVDNYLLSVPGGGHEDIYTSPTYNNERIEFFLNGHNFLHNILCGAFVLDTDDPVMLSKMVDVYPNPSSNRMTLDIGEINAAYDVRVYDQLGRQVSAYNNQRDSKMELERAKIGSGIYFVEVSFRDQSFPPVVRKIMFQ